MSQSFWTQNGDHSQDCRTADRQMVPLGLQSTPSSMPSRRIALPSHSRFLLSTAADAIVHVHVPVLKTQSTLKGCCRLLSLWLNMLYCTASLGIPSSKQQFILDNDTFFYDNGTLVCLS